MSENLIGLSEAIRYLDVGNSEYETITRVVNIVKLYSNAQNEIEKLKDTIELQQLENEELKDEIGKLKKDKNSLELRVEILKSNKKDKENIQIGILREDNRFLKLQNEKLESISHRLKNKLNNLLDKHLIDDEVRFLTNNELRIKVQALYAEITKELN